MARKTKLKVAAKAPEHVTFPVCMAKIWTCASDGSTRYAIDGVEIKHDKKTLTMSATDGRRLVRLQLASQAGPIATRIVDRHGFRSIAKGRASCDMVFVSNREASAEYDTNNSGTKATTKLSIVDGKFPKVDDDIIPIDAPLAIACFSAELLREMLQVAEAITADDDRGPIVKMSFYKPRKRGDDSTSRPIRIDASGDNGVSMVGMLMPVNPEGFDRVPGMGS